MKNYINQPKKSTKKIRIDNFFKGVESAFDQSVLPQDIAVQNYNFDFFSGALTDGYGVEQYAPLADFLADRLFVFKQNCTKTNQTNQTLLLSQNGQIYTHFRQQIGAKKQPLKINGRLKGINYRLLGEDVLLINSSSDNMAVFNGTDTPYFVDNSPQINALSVHLDRLFVTDIDGENLRFSTDLDPTNWTKSLSEGGYIKMVDDRGRIGNLVSFLNHLYIFRENGISRLSNFADQSTFSLTNLFVSSGKIFFDSVALIGDRIVFLASDGLYLFDGFSTKRVLTNLTNVLNPTTNAKGFGVGGKYFLACNLKMDDKSDGNDDKDGDKNDDNLDKNDSVGGGLANNGLVVFEPSLDKYALSLGFCISDFAFFEDQILVLSGKKVGVLKQNGKNFDKDLTKKWVSPMTDLGTENSKVLTEFSIDTNVDMTFFVKSEERGEQFDIKKSNSAQKIKVNLKGNKLSFGIFTTKSGCLITRPVLTIVDRG
ncbi:MAG: hypothetical protein FWD86_00395 [Firmicutes bacterium]|nr:hypothetical protein [Bacillota bacterium]